MLVLASIRAASALAQPIRSGEAWFEVVADERSKQRVEELLR